MTLNIPLRLVYHLYVPKAGFTEIYKYHFACLKYFAHIFDEYVINISMEENDNDTILKIEKLFLFTLGINKNVTFNIIENDINFREVTTFKSEILDKISFNNTLTFFCHSKGITNNFGKNLILWICYMYYFSLNSSNNVKNILIGPPGPGNILFYGPLAMYDKTFQNIKYRWHYPGAFYWINMPSLYNFFNINKNEIPKINDRCFAENFPGQAVEISNYLPSVKWAAEYYLINDGKYNFYSDCETVINICFSKNQVNEFNDFVDYIESDIQKNSYTI